MNRISFSRKAIFGIFVFLTISFFSARSFAQRDPNIITSRNYVGIEAGFNESWLAGAGNNFYFTYQYPYSDDLNNPVTQGVVISNLGSGAGFHVGATLDFSLSDFIALQGKITYRASSSSRTEQHTFICPGMVDPVSGQKTPDDSSAIMEDNYKLSLGYFGISAGVRLQIIPGSWYGNVGLEYSGLVSNRLEGYQKIISSTNQCEFFNLPSNTAASPARTEASFNQTSNNHFNTSQAALKLGTGTFIELGTSHLVLVPELSVGIPLLAFFDKTTEDEYKNGFPTNNPKDPFLPTVTTPKMWYAAFSISLKFPFGAMSKADME